MRCRLAPVRRPPDNRAAAAGETARSLAVGIARPNARVSRAGWDERKKAPLLARAQAATGGPMTRMEVPVMPTQRPLTWAEMPMMPTVEAWKVLRVMVPAEASWSEKGSRRGTFREPCSCGKQWEALGLRSESCTTCTGT